MFKFYIKTFTAQDVYDTSWVEVTDNVKNIGTIITGFDEQDFTVGTKVIPNASVTVDNSNGKFSDVDYPNSVFFFSRANSIFRVTYTEDSTETEVYRGLIKDDNFKLQASKQDGSLLVAGTDTIFQETGVVSAAINNGDTLKTVIYTILNIPQITNLLTVSLSNINPTNGNLTINDKSWFTNKTVKAALDNLMIATNSIYYINSSQEIIVRDREDSPDIKYTFRGQGVSDGEENIIDIKNFNNGRHRVFNRCIFDTTTTNDTTSQTLNGLRIFTINADYITNTTTQESLAGEITSEYNAPKEEFLLTTELNSDTLALVFFDKVVVNFPKGATVPPEIDMPFYGAAVYGTDIYPYTYGSFEIDPVKAFKIQGIRYDVLKKEISFKLRQRGTGYSDGSYNETESAVYGYGVYGEAIYGQG